MYFIEHVKAILRITDYHKIKRIVKSINHDSRLEGTGGIWFVCQWSRGYPPLYVTEHYRLWSTDSICGVKKFLNKNKNIPNNIEGVRFYIKDSARSIQHNANCQNYYGLSLGGAKKADMVKRVKEQLLRSIRRG